ncbi:MAG: heme-binding protein [Lachnospiraceae bacterium]|nr:heme-binding protein [Lachnospiraceae bacterium]
MAGERDDAPAAGVAAQAAAGRAEVTLKGAVWLIQEIEREALRMGVKAVVAVTNRGARPVAVHCMDDSYIASYEIALGKAYTSAALKMATADLKKLAQPGGELYGIQHTNEGKIVIFGGGVPITRDGAVIGGLGISGGSEAQDTALAQYGEKRMKEAADLWQ